VTDIPQEKQRLVEYYSRRAREYEAIYYRPDGVRRDELEHASAVMTETMRGRRALELACGSGYWTALLAPVVSSLHAVDASEQMLYEAQQKTLPDGVVTFSQGDVYETSSIAGSYDAGFANFWLSHVPKSLLPSFLADFNTRVGGGAVMFFMDNCNVSGYGGENVHREGSEDTYKRRMLADGTTRDIIKNYFGRDELQRLFSPFADELTIHVGKFYWHAHYRLAVDNAPD